MLFGGYSKGLIDIYTFSHISHGILFNFIFQYLQFDFVNGLYLTIFFEVLWEMFENTDYIIKKYRKKYRDYDGDSIVNMIGDILGTIIGYIFAYHLPYISIIYLVASELLLIPHKANLLELSIGSFIKN